MEQKIQLANYFTTAGLSLALFCGLVSFLLNARNTEQLTVNARRVLIGFCMVSLHWSIHQTWFGYRWYLTMTSDPLAKWMFHHQYYLSGSYLLCWIGVVYSTSALLRGNFISNVRLKFAFVVGWWLVLVGVGNLLPL